MIEKMERDYQKALARYLHLDMRAIEHGEKNEAERTQLEATIDKYSFFIDYLKAGMPMKDVREEWNHANSTKDDDDAEYPPVSGGADDDETACGARCQQHNDRMWAQLGPVADDAPMPW